MTTSELKFKVTADTAGGASGFRRLLAPLQGVQKMADKTKASLAGIKSAKATVQVEDKAIARARTEIARLRDEVSKELQADITADTRPAERRIRQLESSIRQLSKHPISPQVNTSRLDGLKSKLSSVTDQVTRIGAGAGRIAGNVGVPLLGAIAGAAIAAGTGVAFLGAKSLVLADKLDNAKISFTQFLGSAGKADKFLNNLRGFAAKTPFEFPELVESTKRLLAFNVPAKQVIPLMKSWGNAAALTGQNVDDLVTIYGQMFAKGKVANEELLQLTERGIPAYQLLAGKLGISVAKVQQLASEGKLGAGALNKLMQAVDQRFGGGMAKQAQTLGGMASTLKDTLSGILTDIGTAVLPIAKSVFPVIISAAENMGKKIKGQMPQIVSAVTSGLKGMLSLPGVLLRGLGGAMAGIAGMVAGVQRSVAGLVLGIAQALDSIPALNIDTTGLRLSAAQMGIAANAMDQAGQNGLNKMNAAAAAADAKLTPLKAKLDGIKTAAQSGMALQLKVDQFDSRIAAVNSKIARLKAMRASAKLDADKSHFDRKIAAAEADKRRLTAKKATVIADAKVSPLVAKIKTAQSKISALKSQKATPEVRAKISDLESKIKHAKAQLAGFAKQKPTSKADLNTKALNKSAAAAISRVKTLDKAKANPKADLNYAALRSAAAAAQRIVNNLHGKTITIHTKRTSSGGGGGGGGKASSESVGSVRLGADMAAALSGVSISLSSAPQIRIYTRDEALADFIGVQVDGRSARVSKVTARQAVMQL